MSDGYFDYNATTPRSDGVRAAMVKAMPVFANPSAKYSRGGEARALLNDARSSMADLLGCQPAEVLFTSGGTESNNLAIRSVLDRFEQRELSQCHVITTAIEHPSVLAVLRWFEANLGLRVSYVAPDRHGRVSAEAFEREITPQTCLVTVMAVNNETGTIQPYHEIARLAATAGIPCHVDAVQAVGKIPLNCDQLGATSVSFSGHKFYSPKGVGGLYCSPSFSLSPLVHGGGQERGIRNGTENTVGLAGLAAGAREARASLAPELKRYKRLRNHALIRLAEHRVPFTGNGSPEPDHQAPWTLNISLDGMRAEALAARLDLCHGIAVSLGSACSNNKEQRRSHVLTAMGLDEERIDSALRISFGRFTTEDHIDRLVAAIAKEVKQLASIASAESEKVMHETG